MSEKTLNKETAAYDGSMLWDEILKAIVDTMPEQLFPLFKEVYGKAYPEGTSIALLKTETSTFWENVKEPPNSTLMDIAIDGNSGEITLRFPHSAVIYPAKNSTIPDHLQCRILFQDNSEHIYQIPTVRIQSYSLAEIGEKHLTLFLPYTILRFRTQKNRRKLTKKELTEYLDEVILILGNEVSAGALTELQYRDYVRLIRHAAERVFAGDTELRKEVDRMTERLIRLPSDEYREMKAEYEAAIAKQKEEIAKQEEEIAKQKAEIRRLQEQLRLAETN